MKKQTEEKEEALIVLTDMEVKEFERELEDYKNSLKDVAIGEAVNPLEFYGEPFENQTNFKGYVINPLLGGVHFSVVDYCLDKKIMRKKENSFAWLIDYEDYKVGENRNFTRILDCPWKEFLPKWNALKNLKDRRLYAQDMEDERLTGIKRERINKIIKKGREELMEKMEWGKGLRTEEDFDKAKKEALEKIYSE